MLGEAAHAHLTQSLKSMPSRLPQQPRAILLCSAHFEESQPTLIAVPPSKLLYDYRGFPPESYTLQYRPPGDTALADSVAQLLRWAPGDASAHSTCAESAICCPQDAGFKPQLESSGRGLDLRTFVPLMMLIFRAHTLTLTHKQTQESTHMHRHTHDASPVVCNLLPAGKPASSRGWRPAVAAWTMGHLSPSCSCSRGLTCRWWSCQCCPPCHQRSVQARLSHNNKKPIC